MLKLKLVKSVTEEEEARKALLDDRHKDNAANKGGMLHGTKVCIELVSNYFWSDRVVCGDSYFASVGCAEELLKNGLRFIGVVKTATEKFPYNYLGKLVLTGNRGDRRGLVRYHPEINQPQMLALVWMDRDRRYFISTAFGLDEGAPYSRTRYRQLVQGCKYTPTERVELVVPQPTVCDTYYKTCSAIDQHNRHRVDTLGIDKKVKVKHWATRVNFSILSMILVDCWQVWSKITTDVDGEPQEDQKEFYSHLVTELINNRFDERVNPGQSDHDVVKKPARKNDNGGLCRCLNQGGA
jgi:hypothetical protein